MGVLLDRIRREAEAEEAAEVEAITSGGNAHRRGKFSDACEVARQETADVEFSKAQNYLLEHSYLVDTASGRGNFFDKFPNAPMDKLRGIVDRAYAVRYPSSTDGDAPTAESGQIAYRSRPR